MSEIKVSHTFAYSSFMEEQFKKLIIRTAEFDVEVKKLLSQIHPLPMPKCRMAIAMAGISIEHADSIRMLLFSNQLTSAMALLRLQFESTARAIWLGYVADDEYIAKHDTPLTIEDDGYKNDVSIDGLMKQLKNTEAVPRQAYFALDQFKSQSWRALGSYIHSGKHPLHRKQAGYPIQMLIAIAQHSTQLMCMSAMTAISMSGNEKIKDEFWDLQNRNKDCFAPYISQQ